MSEEDPLAQCKLTRKVQIAENPLVILCSASEKSNTTDSSSKESCTFEENKGPEYLAGYWDNTYKSDAIFNNMNDRNTSRAKKNSDNFLSPICEDRGQLEVTQNSEMSENYRNLYNRCSSRPNSKTNLNEDSVLNNSFITTSQRILENFQKWANREPLQNESPETNLGARASNTTQSTDDSEVDQSGIYYNINNNYNAIPEGYYPPGENNCQQETDSESGSENYLLLPRDYSFGNALNNINTKPLNWPQQYFSDRSENSKYQNEYEYRGREKPMKGTENHKAELYPKEEFMTSSMTTEYYQIPQEEAQNMYKTALQTNVYNTDDERAALMNLITEYLENQKREGSLVSSSSTSSSNESTVVDASLRRFSTLDHDRFQSDRMQSSQYQNDTDNMMPRTGELEVIAEVPKDEIYSTRFSNYISPLQRLKMQEESLENQNSHSSSSVKSKEYDKLYGHRFNKSDQEDVPKCLEDNDFNNNSAPTGTQNLNIVERSSSVLTTEVIQENIMKNNLISKGVQNLLESIKDEKPMQNIDFGAQPLMPELRTSCSDEHCENKQHTQETYCTSIPITCAGIQAGQICSVSQGYANVLTLLTFVILGGISLVSLKEIYCTCHPSFFLPVTFLSFAIYSAFNAIEAFECITCNMTEFTPHRTAYMVVMTLAIPFLAADAWMRYMKRCYTQVAYVFPCLCLVPFWFSKDPYEIENALLLINGISFATFTMLCCIFQSFIGTAAVIVFVGSFAVAGDLGSTKDTQMQSFLNFCHCIFLLFIAMSLSSKR